MAYVFEQKNSMKSFGSAVCPKCGMLVDNEDVPCTCCLFSKATELTPEEAREFTFAGD